MGHGRQVTAAAGCDVILCDTTEERAREGLARIRENLEEGVRRGKVTAEALDATLERLAPSGDLERAVEGADLVIEAVPERFELKVEVLGKVDAHAPVDAIVATNTSLSVTDLQCTTSRPERRRDALLQPRPYHEAHRGGAGATQR